MVESNDYTEFVKALHEFKLIDFTISVFYKEAFEDDNRKLFSKYGGPFGYFSFLKARRFCSAAILHNRLIRLLSAINEDPAASDPELIGLLLSLGNSLKVKYGLY